MTTNNSNFDYIGFLDGKNITDFNYLVHIKNLKNILINGIYPRNYILNNKIPFFRIDYESVQKQRIRNIERKYGFNIHDYVPIFFSTHTPMLYLICRSSKGFVGLDDKSNQISITMNDIAILKMNRNIIIEKDVQFSNKNCACSTVVLYQDLKDLMNLNWDDITRKNLPYDQNWTYAKIMYEQKMFRFNKSAEILIPTKIQENFINRIIVYDKNYVCNSCQNLKNISNLYEDKKEFEW